MRNTKIISILLVCFVIITVWTQIPDIKNFLIKAGIVIRGQENIVQNEDLQAFPYLESQGLTSDTIVTNLPGPLSRLDGDELGETDAINIKQPSFNLYEVIGETNLYRSQSGLGQLEMSATLNKMAEEKLNDMFARGYFEHVSPQGVSIEDIAEENDYEYLVIGENLALGGFKSAKDVVEAWANSEPHRKNMLDARYTEIGVAVKRALYQGHATTIIVQHFGKSISSCPMVSKQTKDTIDDIQNELKTLKDRIEVLKQQIEDDYSESAVEEHNKLVSSYNKKLARLKTLVEEYNQEVENFNKCVEKVTS